MSLDNKLSKVLIIDFGSQFTQLIARRVRELAVFSEIISHTKVNLIDIQSFNLNKLSKKKINIINVDLKFKKAFDKISNKSNHYIEECFQIALKLLKKNIFAGLINGPISKKNFLGEKFSGITEYLAHKTNKDNKVAMLIYNKKLSVSPTTTHLPLKLVNKNLSKKILVKMRLFF